MNYYESKVAERIIALGQERRYITMDDQRRRGIEDDILMLVDCLVDFREPPKELAVEDGYGAMAVTG